jgi:hypothetical protein
MDHLDDYCPYTVQQLLDDAPVNGYILSYNMHVPLIVR